MDDVHVPQIDADQLPTEFDATTVLLDVREDDEWARGHAAGAQHIPMSEVPARLGEIDGDATLYVICHAGGRSLKVSHYLARNGFEPTNVTGIQHKAGTISMARNAPGSATGDFSILLSDLEGLDANPKAEGDNVGYAAFGHVVDGMDVVRRIWDVPRSPTLGEGFLKGQMLEKPVRIVSARRIEIPAPAPTPAPPPPTP